MAAKVIASENASENIEFDLGEARGVSSGEFLGTEKGGAAVSKAPEMETEVSTKESIETQSPVFKELASVELPQLAHINRGRLQMQSPNRLYFYWSVAPNPFRKLNRALGMETADYTLALKLVNLDRETEELHRVDEEGSWWFNVDADRRYRAEIGFYSPSRPFVRVLFSNTVATPRKSPSPRTADAAHWKVTSDRFAKILDVSGFSQDAFDVALAGDEPQTADDASRVALAKLTGEQLTYADLEAQEIRLALLLLASGATLESLRSRISARLFAVLQANIEKLGSEETYRVMSEHFEIDGEEFDVDETGPTVYGASLVNFPRRLRTRRRLPGEYAPVSSFTVANK